MILADFFREHFPENTNFLGNKYFKQLFIISVKEINISVILWSKLGSKQVKNGKKNDFLVDPEIFYDINEEN